MFCNAHFRGKDDIAWIPEDFLGTGNREKRKMEALQSKIATARANSELAKIQRGMDDVDGIPDWAKGEYHGAAKGIEAAAQFEEVGDAVSAGVVDRETV